MLQPYKKTTIYINVVMFSGALERCRFNFRIVLEAVVCGALGKQFQQQLDIINLLKKSDLL